GRSRTGSASERHVPSHCYLTLHSANLQSNYPITRLPNDQIPASVHRPRFRDEKLFVEADRIAVGHAGDEVPYGRVEAFRLDGAAVEELVRPLESEGLDAAIQIGRAHV